eukprot:2215935-Pleurochrysis_carterae.AAC.1
MVAREVLGDCGIVGDGGGDGDWYLKKKTDEGHVCMTTLLSTFLSALQYAVSVKGSSLAKEVPRVESRTEAYSTREAAVT